MPQIDIDSSRTDPLAPAVHDLLNLNKPAAYAQLVVTAGGNQPAADLLRALSSDQLLIKPITSRPDADAMLAGLWLWHDWLDSSHALSNPTGSFWYAIIRIT